VSPGVLLPMRDIELHFEEEEARAMYERLVSYRAPAHVLSFDDAWLRFGGNGPLLEFAYFVVQNQTLFARLSSQVHRLRDELRAGKWQADEIELLRRAAVTTAYSARLDLKRLASTLTLEDPARTLDLFEREFLVRVAPDGLFIEGLHPIRSASEPDASGQRCDTTVTVGPVPRSCPRPGLAPRSDATVARRSSAPSTRLRLVAWIASRATL
jgi:hypothetical protein